MGKRSPQKPKKQTNFGRSASEIPPRVPAIQPNRVCQQTIPNSVRRAFFGNAQPMPQANMAAATRQESYADFSTYSQRQTTGKNFASRGIQYTCFAKHVM